MLQFDQVIGRVRGMDVRIDWFRWDSVLIRFSPSDFPDDAFASWFDKWFDMRDQRHAPGKLCEIIHFFAVGGGEAEVDFGTAPAQAFFDLLDVFAANGVKNIVHA